MDDQRKRPMKERPQDNDPAENPHRDSEDSVLEYWNAERQHHAKPVELPEIKPKKMTPDEARKMTDG